MAVNPYKALAIFSPAFVDSYFNKVPARKSSSSPNPGAPARQQLRTCEPGLHYSAGSTLPARAPQRHGMHRGPPWSSPHACAVRGRALERSSLRTSTSSPTTRTSTSSAMARINLS